MTEGINRENVEATIKAVTHKANYAQRVIILMKVVRITIYNINYVIINRYFFVNTGNNVLSNTFCILKFGSVISSQQVQTVD